jgi:hypothetical protein
LRLLNQISGIGVLFERENFKLNEENNMLKKEIAFLREEIQADNLTKIINCKKEM